MQQNLALYVSLIYLLAAIPYAWLGLYAWRKRPAVAVTPFAWAMLGMSFWSFIYGMEIFFEDMEVMLFLRRLEFIGIVSIPVFLLIFALEYTGHSHLLTRNRRVVLWTIPILVLFLVWTNEYHRLIWDRVDVVEISNIHLLHTERSAIFWAELGYSYLLAAVASLMLIMELIQRPGSDRVQVSLIILGFVFPALGSIVYVFNAGPIPGLDIRPLFFLPTGLGLSWAITRYRLLDILPLEHFTVLQNMQSGVIVLNSDQRVLYINPIAEALFGRSDASVLGQPLHHISESHGRTLLSFVTGQRQQMELSIGHGSHAKVFEVTASAVSTVHEPNPSIGPQSMIVLHDITQRKDTEKALTRRESIMSAISLAAGQFLKESSWEHNVPGVLESIGRAANVSRVYVFMNYANEKGLVFTSQCYEWAAPGIKPQINNPALQHMRLRENGLKRWDDKLSHSQPITGLVRDFPEAERKLLESQEILSLAILPIFVENQWWGFIGFDDCTRERQWTGTELEALHTAASIFGAAETRSRTEQKLIRRQRTLSLLHDLVHVSLQSNDLLDMSQTLVDRLGDLLKADGCFLSLWDEEKKQTLPLAAFGPYRDTFHSITPQPGKGTYTESSLKAGHTLVIEDVTAHSEKNSEQAIETRSILVLPLIAGRNKLGAIILTYDQRHRFQAEEVAIGEQAAGLIALALERSQAMEQAQRRAMTSETLRKAGAVVSQTLETDEAVSRILEQLKQVVSYDSASVQLLEGNELVVVGGSGFPDLKEVIGVRFPIPGDNPNTVVLQTAKPNLLNDAQQYDAFRSPPIDNISSWLGVPLTVQDKIIGLLAIDSIEKDHFTTEDIDLVMAFASQVAIALENARLFEETQTQAITDSLTGIYNRRGLFQIGEFEFARARRINRPFSAMILDIDHFKRVNDHYGHATGDQALRQLAERCRKGSRAIDLVGRYGGEEFVLLLTETHIGTARVVAERLRQSIMDDPVQTEAGPLRITVSIGVAEARATDSLKQLIERADKALYDAKRSGRNQVMVNTAHQLDAQT
jgi:diguanylate cyclase (GGDEF)-like protein/PAS domain S-box-containing protein